MAFGFFKKKTVTADTIFHNGHIYTMDQGLPWADAVAVHDGRVMAVGSFSEMDDMYDDETEIIDLDGKYMFPGFIDIHHSPVMQMLEKGYSMDEEEEREIEEEEAKNIFANLDHAAIYEYLVDEEDEEPSNELTEDTEILYELETGDDEEDEVFDDETEYYIDNSDFTDKVSETVDSLSDHGYTTVLNLRTPNEIENEFTNSLIELYTDAKLKHRFFGSLYVNRPAPARLVKEVLGMRRTKCVELGDMIRNEILHVLLDSSEGKSFPQKALNDMLAECSDRGFILFIEAVEHEDLIKAYKAIDYVRNQGYKNNIIVSSDEELTDKEYSEFGSVQTAYVTWRSDVMGRSFFDGNINYAEDAIEHLTLVSSEMLGMETLLGSIEKGKYADFTVFRENLLEMKPSEFGNLYSDMTVVNGVIVHDVEAENDEYMLNMVLYNRT